MSKLFPLAVRDGAVSRADLKEIIATNPAALASIEAIVHPLVAADRSRFMETAKADIVVLDMPLLFETGAERMMDAIACVTVAQDVQEARVLARGTMTPEQFRQILAKQMPNEEKCAKSDFVIETDTLEHARAQVQTVVEQIRKRIADA
jgi:dephospho-CoA kinase